ncbi:AAA family ATPase [Hyalangium versicolor]|uniref:AAA family ATPase n=1 Tax=Hyalangium versicolor TaxID=2861190 RepID=UPI001CCEF148|nr:MoxR family ATPase [Hyalangium versicolor]
MTVSNYKKRFDPTRPVVPMTPAAERQGRLGDRRDGELYESTEQIVLAVNVAMATGRPLLLRGAPGSGKSSLAPWVARVMGWRYYEDVVSSRTQARDLLWVFDAVKRLSDAQAGEAGEEFRYVKPGVLWWAFNRESAVRRGTPPDAKVDNAQEPNSRLNEKRQGMPAVVLIDEIDKADPDVPNDLLVPLGSLQFTVGERPPIVAAHAPFVVLTSNDERELPAAFLRRCVVLELPMPDKERLRRIAVAHFGEGKEALALYERVADKVEALANEAKAQGRRPPSTPEFLDTVKAFRELQTEGLASDDLLEQLFQVTLRKS